MKKPSCFSLQCVTLVVLREALLGCNRAGRVRQGRSASLLGAFLDLREEGGELCGLHALQGRLVEAGGVSQQPASHRQQGHVAGGVPASSDLGDVPDCQLAAQRMGARGAVYTWTVAAPNYAPICAGSPCRLCSTPDPL